MQDLSVAARCQAWPNLDPSDLLHGINRYPYFLHLEGDAKTTDPSVVFNLLGMLPGQRAVCFTRIQRETGAGTTSGLTSTLSRTDRAMPLHTDSSYEDHPHEIVVFQMVRADLDGGETIVAPVSDVLPLLTRDIADTLRQPVFPFGQVCKPILEGDDDDLKVRYYRRQILPGLNPLQAQSARCTAAMVDFDRALAKISMAHRFKLGAGDILILNNRKVLHGRTALAPNTDRLMYRFRKHLDA